MVTRPSELRRSLRRQIAHVVNRQPLGGEPLGSPGARFSGSCQRDLRPLPIVQLKSTIDSPMEHARHPIRARARLTIRHIFDSQWQAGGGPGHAKSVFAQLLRGLPLPRESCIPLSTRDLPKYCRAWR